MNPNPFFPNPLDDFEPEKPDFEPEIDPDYEDNLEEDCIHVENNTEYTQLEILFNVH